MYPVHTSALPLKDNHLRSQAATCASTLARTSNQFRSSWRPGPRMQMDPSLQRKGLGRDTPPIQAPNSKPSLLSKLTLAPANFSYFSTAIFTATMSSWRDTNSVMSSANAEICDRMLPIREIPYRAGRVLSSLNLRSRGSKARTLRRGDKEQPCRTDRLIAKAFERLNPHDDPFVEFQFESGGLQNHR